MKRYRWNRPELPGGHEGWGGALGMLFAIGGLIAIGMGIGSSGNSSPYAGSGLWVAAPFGGLAFSVGVVMMTVSVIVREIRRLAFEAALRAGEVEVIEPKRKPA